MKTQLTYSQRNNHINNNLLMRKHKLVAERNYDKNGTIARENKELNRPARAISFGGSAGLSKGITKAFHKTVEFVNDNEAAYNAIYAWIVAGILKPAAVLAMPGSEDKDKQIVATKNFLQAFLGGFLGLTIGGGFVKKSIDMVKNNLRLIKVTDEKIEPFGAESKEVKKVAQKALEEEYNNLTNRVKRAGRAFKENEGLSKITTFVKTLFKKAKYTPTQEQIKEKAKAVAENFSKNHFGIFAKNEDFTRLLISEKANIKSGTTYLDAFEVLWKNSTGALTAIGKAKVSSLLLPGVMAFLFAKKNIEKAQQEKAKQATLINNSTFKNEQAQFQKMLNKNNTNLTFKGSPLNAAIEGLAKTVEHIGMSKIGEKGTKLLSKAKKPSARMSDLESFAITAYWLQNTARSKKIEPSQKLGLNVHTALVTLVSSTASFIIDWALDGLIDKSKVKHFKKLSEITANIINNTELDESVDSILKDVSDPTIKIAIKDKIGELLKDVKASDIENDKIKTFIDDLKLSNIIPKDLDIDASTIKKAIDSAQKTKDIEASIIEQAQDVLGSKKIASTLSKAISNEGQNAKAIVENIVGTSENLDVKTIKQLLLNISKNEDCNQILKQIGELTTNYGKKLSKFKSLTIFTLVVRFLVPVLMVPFSGKLKKKIIELTDGKPNKPETKKA